MPERSIRSEASSNLGDRGAEYCFGNVRSGPPTVGREVRRSGSERFRKHRRPCGQPAVEGEIGRFRPVPPQAGHCKRIKATPSDLPFKSTGFATYPLPPQLGQSFGATPLPLRLRTLSMTRAPNFPQIVLRYELRTRFHGSGTPRCSPVVPSSREREKLTTTAFDVGVLLLNATLPIGTSTFASGK